jgi:uncharacterized membrane protein YhaH (DUF805 family)
MEWYLKAIRNYANFKGRAQRKEYWFYVLFYVLFAILVALVENFLGLSDLSDPESGTGPLYLVYTLAFLLPSIAVAIRRLHDTGRTGWWLLLAFVPLIGAIVLLVFYCFDSQPGDNEYGPNPKALQA